MLTLLRLPEVIARTGIARSTIYRDIAAGTFPAPIRINDGGVRAWSSKEIDLWIESQIAVARQQPNAKA